MEWCLKNPEITAWGLHFMISTSIWADMGLCRSQKGTGGVTGVGVGERKKEVHSCRFIPPCPFLSGCAACRGAYKLCTPLSPQQAKLLITAQEAPLFPCPCPLPPNLHSMKYIHWACTPLCTFHKNNEKQCTFYKNPDEEIEAGEWQGLPTSCQCLGTKWTSTAPLNTWRPPIL